MARLKGDDTPSIRKRRTLVAGLRLAGIRRREEIRELLATGDPPIVVSLRTIAYDLTAVERIWREELAETVQAEKALDLARIERMIQALWPDVEKGRLPAIDRLVKLLDRKAAMLGYDAPKVIDITGQIREEARRFGLDADEMIRAAEEYLRGGWNR